MADISLPGSGGLMRYNEEYDSKLKFGPEVVIGMVIVTIALVIGLRYVLA
jgi:preprotein translocase subunit Sec61beta